VSSKLWAQREDVSEKFLHPQGLASLQSWRANAASAGCRMATP